MAKKSVVTDEVNPELVPVILETQELLDAPRGVRRLEFVKVAQGTKIYFRAYTKYLEVPNLVSVSYPNLKIAKERWNVYVETGKVDLYYKKGKK